MKITEGIWIKPGILLIILLSFFTFSENFFPLLNSDMAVNILMTPSFSLPHDIYFWGQDRSGNLIPLIAHILYVVTGWQPVLLVSLVHYLILLAGFLALTRFVKTGFGRIVLALVWFFPPWHFLEFLLILYGIQASLVVIGLNFLDRSFKTKLQWKCLIYLSASCLIFILAVWVSDMVLISLSALLITGVLYFKAAGKDPGKLLFRSNMLVPALCVIIWIVAGCLVLHYAKAVSTPVQAYDKGFFADLSAMVQSAGIVLGSALRVLAFSSESNIESVFAWGLLGSFIIPAFSKKNGLITWPEITRNPWFYFFLIEAVLTIIAVLASRWVAANGTARRYFTTFFMSSWICLILWLENLPKTNWKKTMQFAIAITVVTGSLSGSFRFYYPEIKPSRIRVLSALTSMGNIGIIAEYWNAYMTASPDPAHIKATPHDKDYVRNRELVAVVFKQPRIYLIRDGWLEAFPDTIIQFGRVLKRQGRTIHIADAWMNRYVITK